MTTAIAIFVKTPGLTPLKTRLAAGIGPEKALEFYDLSLKCLIETIKETNLKPYWAVGEKEGLNHCLWQDFDTIHTGDGDLGERQHNIYQTLLKKHDNVILIGADAPQITIELFHLTLDHLKANDYVFGPASDGGYYLLGGNEDIQKNIWQQVPWSAPNTLEKFKKLLPSHPVELPHLTDIDEQEDLKTLLTEMPKNLSSSQQKLSQWIKDLNL